MKADRVELFGARRLGSRPSHGQNRKESDYFLLADQPPRTSFFASYNPVSDQLRFFAGIDPDDGFLPIEIVVGSKMKIRTEKVAHLNVGRRSRVSADGHCNAPPRLQAPQERLLLSNLPVADANVVDHYSFPTRKVLRLGK